MTYLEAKDVCAQNGLVLHNKLDPWTSACSTPLLNRLKAILPVGASFFDINDATIQGERYAKQGLICTALNFSKCCSRVLLKIYHNES